MLTFVGLQVSIKSGLGETRLPILGTCLMISASEPVRFCVSTLMKLRANVPQANWARVLEILNVNSFVLDYTNFWGRNGPDILEVCIL